MQQKLGGRFLVIGLSVILSAVALGLRPPRRGIDLQGGTSLIYKVDFLGAAQSLWKSRMQQTVDVLARRIDPTGVGEIKPTPMGEDQIQIQIPGAINDIRVKRIKGRIEKAGNLEFKLVVENPGIRDEIEFKRGTDPGYQHPEYELLPDKSHEDSSGALLVKRRAEMTGSDHISSAKYTVTPAPEASSPHAIEVFLTAEGSREMDRVSTEYLKHRLAIILDGKICSAPVLKSRITSVALISGNFTEEEAKELVNILNAGSLQVQLTPAYEEAVGPDIGEESIRRGTLASLLSIVLVGLFMIFYYRLAGFITVAMLALNLFMTLALLGIFGAVLTLPGIAGLALTVGMAVDANVLILERIREERARGRGVLQALQAGYDRAFLTIFDSNLTTLITGAILFAFGTGPIRGFAVTLSIGLIVSMYTALFCTKTVALGLVGSGTLKDFHFREWLKPPNVNWIRWFRPAGLASLVLCLGGLALFVSTRTRTYDIDLTGGSQANVRLVNDPGYKEVSDRIGKFGWKFSLQSVTHLQQKDAVEYSVRIQYPDAAGPEIVRKFFEASYLDELFERKDPGASRATVTALEPLTPGRPLRSGIAVKVKFDEAYKIDDLRRTLSRQGFKDPVVKGAADPAAIKTDSVYFEVPADRLEKVFSGPFLKFALREKLSGLLEPEPFGKIDSFVPPPLDGAGPPSGPVAERDKGWRAEIHLHPTAAATPGEIETALKNGLSAPDVKVTAMAGPTPKDAGKTSDFEVRFSPNAMDAVRKFMRNLPGTGDLSQIPTADLIQQAVQDTLKDRLAQPFPRMSIVGAAVAERMQTKAIWATLISLLGILAYCGFRFQIKYGYAAILALVHDVLITVGALALFNLLGWVDVFVNLATIAAVLTIIGYSVNDTIVIFDRIRENLGILKGKSYPDIVNLSVNQTMSRTLITGTTTLVSCFCLFLFGKGQGSVIEGLSFCLIVGCISGMYSTVFIASPVLVGWSAKTPAPKA